MEITDINPNKVYTIISRLHEADGTVVMQRIYEDVSFEEADALFMSELTIPAFELSEQKYYFSETIYEKGKDDPTTDVPVAEHNDATDAGQTITMEEALHTILVNKVDAFTKQAIISNAFEFQFDFYKDDVVVDSEVVAGDESTGIATLTFKGKGNYDKIHINEIAAPVGFILSDEVKEVHMSDFDENLTHSFEYFNTPLPSDVVTGVHQDAVVYTTLLLLSLGVVSLYAIQKTRKSKATKK